MPSAGQVDVFISYCSEEWEAGLYKDKLFLLRIADCDPDGLLGRRAEFPGSLPPIWNITEERNAFFTGRDEMLEQLHQALTEGRTAALTQAVFGLDGVGKTRFAVEYAYRYAGEYEGVWWPYAEEPVTLAWDCGGCGPEADD